MVKAAIIESTIQQGSSVKNIPNDWMFYTLRDVATLHARIGWQGLTTREYLKSGQYYLIGGVDFDKGKIDWKNCYFVSESRYKQDRNIQLNYGDILITKDGTIGKIAFVDKSNIEATLNSGVFVVRPKNKVFYPKFMYYIFTSEYFNYFLNQLSAGSTIIHLYQKDFVDFEFPLPEFKEQQKIAAALSDMDELINALEKVINKKKKVKQGTMQQLLTEKIGFESNSGTRMLNFKEVFITVSTGKFQLKSSDYMMNGIYPIVDQGKKFIIGFSNDKSKVFYPSCNGVIVFGDHTRMIKFLNFPFVVGADGTKVLEVKTGNHTKFLYYYLNNLNLLDTGYNRHFSQLKEVKFNLPPLQEQQAIASVLSDMDNEIEALEMKLGKYKQIKEGMMQELLTGRIRLV